MDRQQRQVLRIAAAIHDQYVRQQHNDIRIDLPDDAWQYCLKLIHKIDRAGQHAWYGAAGRLRQELAGRLDLFRSNPTRTSRNHRGRLQLLAILRKI